MPLYKIEYSYTPDAWDALIEGGVERNRQRAVEDLVKALGGRFPRLVFDGEPKVPDVASKHFTFGESDVTALIHFPDNQAAAAFAMLISATRSVKSFRTTPLLSIDEAIATMQKAKDAKSRASGYAAPLRAKPAS